MSAGAAGRSRPTAMQTPRTGCRAARRPSRRAPSGRLRTSPFSVGRPKRWRGSRACWRGRRRSDCSRHRETLLDLALTVVGVAAAFTPIAGLLLAPLKVVSLDPWFRVAVLPVAGALVLVALYGLGAAALDEPELIHLTYPHILIQMPGGAMVAVAVEAGRVAGAGRFSQPELDARFFRGLADPCRVRLLELLLAGEKNVSELVEETGLAQNRVSTHLACLRSCGFVAARREGRFAYYQVTDPRVRELLRLARQVVAEHAAQILACDVA